MPVVPATWEWKTEGSLDPGAGGQPEQYNKTPSPKRKEVTSSYPVFTYRNLSRFVNILFYKFITSVNCNSFITLQVSNKSHRQTQTLEPIDTK